MSKRLKIAALLILPLVLAATVYWVVMNDPARMEAQLLDRGRKLNDSAPPPRTTEWMNWYKGLSADDRVAWARFTDNERIPPAPKTAAKFSACQFSRSEPSADAAFPVAMLSNYKQVLRVDNSISIMPLQAKISRNQNGELITSFWARRAADAFTINWKTGALLDFKIDTVEAGDSPTPQIAEVDTAFSGGSFRKPSWITFRIKDKTQRFDWERRTRVTDLVVAQKYSFAFGLEMQDEPVRAIVGLVWLDRKTEKVGRIKIPEPRNGVHVIYREDLQALLVFDSTWDWILCLDLKPRTTP